MRTSRPAFGLALLMLVLIAACTSHKAPSSSPAATRSTRTTVASFRGTGDQTTDSFTVKQGWQIQWRNTGKSFSFAITGDRDYGTIIKQTKPASGVTSPVGSGKFRLKIAAEGGWSIQIFQPK